MFGTAFVKVNKDISLAIPPWPLTCWGLAGVTLAFSCYFIFCVVAASPFIQSLFCLSHIPVTVDFFPTGKQRQLTFHPKVLFKVLAITELESRVPGYLSSFFSMTALYWQAICRSASRHIISWIPKFLRIAIRKQVKAGWCVGSSLFYTATLYYWGEARSHKSNLRLWYYKTQGLWPKENWGQADCELLLSQTVLGYAEGLRASCYLGYVQHGPEGSRPLGFICFSQTSLWRETLTMTFTELVSGHRGQWKLRERTQC